MPSLWKNSCRRCWKRKAGLNPRNWDLQLHDPADGKAIAAVGAENIATNQIELSPYLQNRKVVDWAKQHGIHITSYMTLAYGKALKDEVIIRIAEKHNATAAQVILAWAMGEGYAVIPSSTKRENRRATC